MKQSKENEFEFGIYIDVNENEFDGYCCHDYYDGHPEYNYYNKSGEKVIMIEPM